MGSRVSDESPPPRELLLDVAPAPGDLSQMSGSAMAPVVVSVLVAGALAKYVNLTAAGLALVGALVVSLVLRKPRLGRFVLRVEGDALEVRRERAPEAVARVTLAEVVDVTVERKRAPATGRGAPPERVQIALERSGAESVLVPEEPMTPIEGEEWHAKVRVFLRKHGWVPRDERTSP